MALAKGEKPFSWTSCDFLLGEVRDVAAERTRYYKSHHFGQPAMDQHLQTSEYLQISCSDVLLKEPDSPSLEERGDNVMRTLNIRLEKRGEASANTVRRSADSFCVNVLCNYSTNYLQLVYVH